jgi:diaminopimelate decarboxylase
MKPMGNVPVGFSADPVGQLAIGGHALAELLEHAGDTPLFVYDMALVRSRIADLRKALPADVGVHYAIKANPMPALVQEIAELVDGLDVASEGELRIALTSDAGHVSFAGPGKRDRELEAAILSGVTINLESEGEAQRALSIADRLGITPRLAVRVNPDFDLKGSGMRMGGGAKPFGVDADRAASLVRLLIEAGADWQGFHIFAGSQALDADAISETQAQTIQLAGRLAEDAGAMPPLVNLGGGFGIPYFPGDRPVDLETVGSNLSRSLQNRSESIQKTRFVVELGRYLVGEAGVYLSRVVDRKKSHGETFLVVDGGLHHQLAASGNFGTVVRRNYPLAVASRFTAAPDEVVNVVGCLCTPLDRLGDQVGLPKADVGDVIAVFMAGAYGATASPASFLGHPPAREMLVNGTFAEIVLT